MFEWKSANHFAQFAGLWAEQVYLETFSSFAIFLDFFPEFLFFFDKFVAKIFKAVHIIPPPLICAWQLRVKCKNSYFADGTMNLLSLA